MKAVIAIFALLSSVATTVACADQGNQQPAPAAVEQYHYGMPLDIAKVISITPASDIEDCKVGTARMAYLDQQGQRHDISFREMGNCSQM